MQTILGSGGVIGNEISKYLHSKNIPVRQVSRNPEKVNKTDELISADLTDPEAVQNAVKGSDVAYLAAGLTYDIRVWREMWPKIMQNCIAACNTNNSKLVFFDNVYCYGKVDGWMTEETPVAPSSKKGQVRARIAEMLMDAINNNELKALIARAPDFYGPDTPLSFINVTVLENMAKGKKAQILVSDKYKHSLIYTPDAGRATAILGNTEDAYQQVWHLPTDKNALTGKEFVEIAAKYFEMEPKYMVAPKWILKIMGWFNPIIRESNEMLYQNDSEYLFDSTKFEKRFPDFKVTPYEEGIKNTVESYKTAKR